MGKPPDDSEEPWHHDATLHEERPTPTSHAHAHAHTNGRHESAHIYGSFPHEKLNAYQVALEMAALANKLAEQIPRGHRNVADHMLRAASNTALLLAEGANRRG